jgi:hypothetical protein
MITFIQEWMGKCSSREKVEMKIPEKGMKKEDLFKTLKSYKGEDVESIIPVIRPMTSSIKLTPCF